VFRSGDPTRGGNAGGTGQSVKQITDYLGPFLYMDWDVSEDLTLEAGIRWNWERKEFEVLGVGRRDPITGIGPATGFEGLVNSSKARGVVSEPSGDLILTYNPTIDLSFYVLYTRGMKGQHFNGNAVGRGSLIRPVEPEFVDQFEIGTRSAFWDGLLKLEFAAFHYAYENQQIFQVQNGRGRVPVNQLVNADASRILGLEGSVRVNYEGAEFFTTVGYLFSEYSKFANVVENISFNATDPANPLVSTEIEDFSGNRLVSSPELSIAGYVSYEIEVGSLGKLTPRLDYSWRDEIFFTPRNDSRIGDDALFLLNARLTYATPNDSVRLAIWMRNVTNEIYRATAVDLERVNSSFVYLIGDPRTYGITASIRF